ncbi:MAG: hypothetical protein AB1757_29050 [Acidobacteriota bacterium]
MTNKQLLLSKTENLSETEITQVLNYITAIESAREKSTRTDLFDDDMVSLLSDATENRRARVVAEWDKIRRRAEIRDLLR